MNAAPLTTLASLVCLLPTLGFAVPEGPEPNTPAWAAREQAN